MIKDKLEIILVTYNRMEQLNNTLEQLFAVNSPIKDCKFTIIDNHSTDGTAYICDIWQKHFPHIEIIRNKRNIGGCANMTKAMELCGQLEYTWIICDDDVFDFSNWSLVENAINDKIAVINVSNFNEQGIDNRIKLLRRSCFLPSVIYRSELVDDHMMQQAYDTGVSTLFPAMLIPIKVLNEKLSFKLLPNIVYTGSRTDHDTSYNRGCKDIHPFRRTLFWHVGYIIMCQFIKNQHLRNIAVNQADVDIKCFLRHIVRLNRDGFENKLHNLTDVWCCLNGRQKWIFVIELCKQYLFNWRKQKL